MFRAILTRLKRGSSNKSLICGYDPPPPNVCPFVTCVLLLEEDIHNFLCKQMTCVIGSQEICSNISFLQGLISYCEVKKPRDNFYGEEEGRGERKTVRPFLRSFEIQMGDTFLRVLL